MSYTNLGLLFHSISHGFEFLNQKVNYQLKIQILAFFIIIINNYSPFLLKKICFFLVTKDFFKTPFVVTTVDILARFSHKILKDF